jgi:hypothetical protein
MKSPSTSANVIQRVFRRRLVRKNLLRPKKSVASLGRISKTCCERLGIDFFGGQKRMFTALTSKIHSGVLLRRRYKALGRQLMVSFTVSAEAALNYEMALAACSDEHRRSCHGRNAVQLTIEALRLDVVVGEKAAASALAAAAASVSSTAAAAAAAKTSTEAAATAAAQLHRIFSGCCPKTSSGWDVVHYGLRHGATGAAAFVIYDVVEAMQLAGVYDDARHDPGAATATLLANPIEVARQFFGPLGFDAEEEAAVIGMLGCSDLYHDADSLEMMHPAEMKTDAIFLFLKTANKRAYALRAKAHKDRGALLNAILAKQTGRAVQYL